MNVSVDDHRTAGSQDPATAFCFAGLVLSVQVVDPRIRCAFADPLTRFLSEPSTKANLALSVRGFEDYTPSTGELLFESGGVWRMFRDGERSRIECWSDVFGPHPYKIAWLDEDFAAGEIALRLDVTTPGVNPLEYPLDELLVSLLLGRGQGVELHGCGIIDLNGRGHLFVGQSGAGKTTTARLWSERAAEIVSDDRVIVRESEGKLQFFGTPWHGEAELSSPTAAPLSGIYLLEQSAENKLRELSVAEAVARLFTCTFPQFHDGKALAWTLAFFERIARQVPVRVIEFRRDQGAVDLVLTAASMEAA